MDTFCNSTFWNRSVSWETPDPDFTECFERTVLLWSTCGFLWIAGLFDVYFRVDRRSKLLDAPSWRPGWTKLARLKIFNTALLICMQVAMLCTSWIQYTEDKDGNILEIPHVLWTAPVILIFTHLLSGGLVVLHKLKCVHTSWIQLLHWTLLSLVSAITFRTEYRKYLGGGGGVAGGPNLSLSFLGMSSAVTVIQMICFCWSDIPTTTAESHAPLTDDSHLDDGVRTECPVIRASCLSYIFFSWSTHIIRKSNKRTLKKEDLWVLPPSFSAKPLTKVFDHHYGAPGYGETRGIWKNIIRPIWKTCGCSFTLSITCRLMGCLLQFLAPKLMGYMITFVEDKSVEVWKGYALAILLFLNYIVITVFLEQFYLHMFKCYSSVLTCLNLKIYRKSLCVSSQARKDTTTGEIVNLMSVDVEKIRTLLYMADALWATPIQIVVGIVLLWSELGVAILAGLAVLIAIIPINWALTTLSSKYQRAQMKKKDERIKIINEVISGIQAIKLYAWEHSFQAKIQKIRSTEIQFLRKCAFVRCFMDLIFESIPFLVSTAAFMTFLFIDRSNALTPARAFTALSLFNLLTDPITQFPQCISQIVDASVSFKRVNKFLNSEEFHPGATKREEQVDGLPAVEIRNGNFAWERDNPCLSHMNLEVTSGSLTVIVGKVASGKSSLLSAMLGNMRSSGQTIVRASSIAYVPQIAWIINETLRENICFGLPYEKQKYEMIIDACCLGPDIEILPAGDMTEIGEKGINLSGGQKQRVSLARAAYSGADLLLLDDVLSAVDAHVGKRIFDQLLGPKGLLANKTRVLCTHAYNFLSQVDLIVVMSDGEIVERGSYEELRGSQGNFSRLLTQHVQSKDSDQKDGESTQGPTTDSETNKKKDVNKTGKLIEEEKIQEGTVKVSVYATYLRAMGFTLAFVFTMIFGLSQGLEVGRNVVLSKWTSDNETEEGATNTGYLMEYCVFGIAQSVTSLFGVILLTIAYLRAAKKLHNDMLTRILGAPMRFFNVTLVGRILNRFSSDVNVLDNELPSEFGDWICHIFKVIGVLAAISYANAYFIVFVIPLFVTYYFLQRYYIVCMQQLQRLMSALDSPIFSQFSESLNGISTIRAYEAQERFTAMLAQKIDDYVQANLPHLIVRRWLSIRLGILGSMVILVSAIFAVVWRDEMSSSLVGLSLTYAIQITGILSWLIKVTSYVQYNFVSVERVSEYSAVEQEADFENPNNALNSNWPEHGAIEFNNFETQYRPGLDLVLRNFTCKILPGEKIGVVGRTGAGKSTLTLSLFRIIEATNGEIMIDNVNISSLGLHDIRKRLTVIPQDPTLFGMNLRHNLDPFEECSDDQLWQALELAHLKTCVESLPEGLNHQIAEGGENLSVGQRQLVCLARAILKKSSILVLDEATASVDCKTDELIQQTIRSTFGSCTIINVAHRLNTVLDSTRILVLSRGEIVEFDTPENLLANQNSQFYGMAKDAGLL